MAAEKVERIPTMTVVWREDLYPRIKPDMAVIARYAENLEVLPPIEVNQNNILIDGYHRWTAHRQANAETVPATVTETASENEVYALAIERNASHGLQLAEPDKRQAAIRLYASGTGLDKDRIAQVLSVSRRTVSGYLSDIDKQLREQRRETISAMWLACYTQEEIADAVGVDRTTTSRDLEEVCNLAMLPKSTQLSATYSEPDWTPPIYNLWTFAKLSNATRHFGNSEQRILDNLLYLYTEPGDIVIDPFAGGASTVDVCKRRFRRYWASDRNPKPGLENEVRQLDIATELPPLHKRWSEVTLTYLDPPYWRQAAGEYSDDPRDLGNMPLMRFTEALADIIRRISDKQSRGAIAMLMQPTQWRADDRRFTDHIFDVIQAVGNSRLRVANRVSCPYATEQCTPQMVDWAKENKQLLVLTRELVIWEFA